MSEQKNLKKSDSKEKKWISSPKDIIFTTILTIAFISQIILFFIFNNELNLVYLEYFGYGLWVLSAILGIFPIIIFKRKGKVTKGKSYMHTEKIVTTGLYAIVRHPQYLAGILLSIGITCITQHWISLILTVVIIVLTYDWTFSEDKMLIEKFGDEYKEYKERVARLNPLLGVIYYFIKKK